MNNRLGDELQPIVASMDNPENQEQEINSPQDGLQDIYVLIVREHEEEEEHLQVVDSTVVLPQKTSMMPAYAIGGFYILLIVSTLAFQLYCIVNPPIATVTIIPKSQTVSMTGTLQLGRVLPPLTISQSQTTLTTGKGHQDAKAATGYLTLYNGQFQNVTIAAGTILIGASGVQVVTEQDATIPAGNPPSYGQVSVSTHALSPGVRGNIPAYDINQACCAASVLVKNTQPFNGGQDERDYQTVTKSDIISTATSLKTAVAQSVAGAFQGQLKPGEVLHLLPCAPTITSNHDIGQEATSVKVTVSQMCSAIAYSSQELNTKATAFLATQAQQQTGAGYSLFGTIHMSFTTATITNTTKPLVFVSFRAQGTWIYGLSRAVQQQIKHMVAGKTIRRAGQLLATLPGVAQASIQFTGFGDDNKLPKQSSNIHFAFIVV